MSWSKLHTDKWLYGKIRGFDPVIRSVWPDLQAQADSSPIRGVVCIAPGVGYTVQQMAKMWKTPEDIINSAFEKFVVEGWITINDDGTITLNEWLRFQDEYQRLKKYRITHKDTKKNTKKGTGESTK